MSWQVSLKSASIYASRALRLTAPRSYYYYYHYSYYSYYYYYYYHHYCYYYYYYCHLCCDRPSA